MTSNVSQELQDIVLSSFDSMAACRDVPEVVIKIARERFLMTEESLADLGWRGYSGMESSFGITRNFHHDYFPASAYQGPFFQLLRYNHDLGLEFIIDLLNSSCDWYGNRILPSESVEFPETTTVIFSDGTSRQQWCNDRLWKMYRGTSVGPTVLQSALMALEVWLFEVAEASPNHLDSILQNILRQSNNVALTAVVASLAIAYPDFAIETLLVLLLCPECILLDKHRMVADLNPPSSWSIQRLDSRYDIYDEERKKSDSRPHRGHDLEVAILKIQMGSSQERVQQILDQYRDTVPTIQEQNEMILDWRLTLHRMDLRRYQSTHEEFEVSNQEPFDQSTQKMSRIRVSPVAAEPDLESIISQSTTQYAEMDSRLSIQMWGLHTFERKNPNRYDPKKWKEYLSILRSQTFNFTDKPIPDLGNSAFAFIATVCIRDHWYEMSTEEQTWCVVIVCSEIEKHCNEWNQIARVQKYSMCGDRPAAWVISSLIDRVTDPDLQSRMHKALILALTHSNIEVRNYAAKGVGENLWAKDREMTIRCVNLIASEAIKCEEQCRKQEAIHYSDRQMIDQLESEVAKAVREDFFKSDGVPADALSRCEPSTWAGSEAFLRILTILLYSPAEDISNQAFRTLAETLIKWWKVDNARRNTRTERPTEIEPLLTFLLERFLLLIPAESARSVVAPFLDNVNNYPRELSWILRGLIGREDREPNTPQFWYLWELFAEKITAASWLNKIDNEHSKGFGMISCIFLSTGWKDEVRHWRSLEGYADRIHSLFDRLPVSASVFENYVSFLYHIGERSLPGAFIQLAEKLKLADSNKLLRKSNTVYLLEILLRRHVYVRPRELKLRANLRETILYLLDLMVERGSSAAFKMRDDFVTPLSIS